MAQADDCPFDHSVVQEAFPEFRVCDPHLGVGTFKVAYRVVCADGSEEVLKIVKEPLEGHELESDQPQLPTRLDREITGMKKVKSDHVVEILAGPEIRSIGTTRHVCYREPHYADGTLDAILGEPLDKVVVGQLADDLLEGIAALWSHNIVHRDIKPQNIALLDGRAILLDLGIAYFADLTPATDAFGLSPRTPIYAAPEQFEIRRLAQIDHRTDQFQVGVVLYEALTARHPFNPNDPDGYLGRLAHGDVDQQPLEVHSIEPEARNFLGRLLASAPNRRYRTPELARQAATEAFR